MLTAVDLRHLAPPEPMEVILDAVATLAPGQCLRYVLPHHPVPLYPLLQGEGAVWDCTLSGDGGVVIEIRRP